MSGARAWCEMSVGRVGGARVRRAHAARNTPTLAPLEHELEHGLGLGLEHVHGRRDLESPRAKPAQVDRPSKAAPASVGHRPSAARHRLRSPAPPAGGDQPGRRSGMLGHHFAGPGNPFWRLLHAAGLTPELLPPEEDLRLAEFGLALTNLCPRPTRAAAELTSSEIARGRAALVRKCQLWQPRVVALVGVTLYAQVFGRRSGGRGGGQARTARWRAGVRGAQPQRAQRQLPGLRAQADLVRAAARVRRRDGAGQTFTATDRPSPVGMTVARNSPPAARR